jgi:hypothetical protein
VLPDVARCVDPPAAPVDRPRRGRSLEGFVKDEPLTALAIAVTAGFILGGGAETRIGRSALGFVGRFAIRSAVSNLLVAMLVGNHEGAAKGSENCVDRNRPPLLRSP